MALHVQCVHVVAGEVDLPDELRPLPLEDSMQMSWYPVKKAIEVRGVVVEDVQQMLGAVVVRGVVMHADRDARACELVESFAVQLGVNEIVLRTREKSGEI